MYSESAGPVRGYGSGPALDGMSPLRCNAEEMASCSEGRGVREGTKLLISCISSLHSKSGSPTSSVLERVEPCVDKGTVWIAICWQAGQATEYSVIIRQVGIPRRSNCDVSVEGVVLLKVTEKSINFALTNAEILVEGGCLTVCFSDDEHVQFFGEAW